MGNRSQHQIQKTQIQQFFSRRSEKIVAAYVYGSRARGADRQDSDLDLAVLFATDPPRTLDGLSFNMATDLERKINVRVDLVVLNRAPTDLVHRVLRDGDLLVERDKSARIRFEVKSRAEYFDLHPILQRYRRRRAVSHDRS